MLVSLMLSLAVAAVLIQVAVFSTTIFLHRTATHRALVLHPAVAWLFRLSLWLTTGIATKEWVAVHRKHHAFTDQEGDPHSPMLMGFWSVQLGNVFHYVKEARTRTSSTLRARHQEDVWIGCSSIMNSGSHRGDRRALRRARHWLCLLAASVHAVMYVFVLSSSINGLCHHVGYKNFDNTATNLRLLALVTGGEGLHNNHHGYPRSPKFSCRASEIDPAWPLIKLLIALRLAKPYKTIEEVAA